VSCDQSSDTDRGYGVIGRRPGEHPIGNHESAGVVRGSDQLDPLTDSYCVWGGCNNHGLNHRVSSPCRRLFRPCLSTGASPLCLAVRQLLLGRPALFRFIKTATRGGTCQHTPGKADSGGLRAVLIGAWVGGYDERRI
jgi:hypothetical protein